MNSRPLRICHLGKYYPPAPGGLERHVRLLARGQAELGAEVRVLCVNHLDSHGRDLTWRPIGRSAAVDESDGPVRVSRIGRIASIARFDLCPALPAAMRDLDFGETDLLHLHAPNPAMLMAASKWARSTPLVISHHSDVVRQKLLGRAFRAFERRAYRRAALVFANSPTYAAGSPLLRQFADRLRCLPLGIDLDPFLAPAAESLRVAAEWTQRFGEPLWLCVGRLVYYKGLENAIRALARVPGRLAIIGTGPREQSLKRLACDEGVSDRLIWCGPVSDETLAGAYRAATALWFPSNARSEAFGLVQVEAMASGCPVINSFVPHSGISWVCRHEEEGLTVPVNDPPALAAAVRRLLDEPGLRERLAGAGRDRAIREFAYQTMAARCLNLYREVMEKDGRPFMQAAAQ